MKKKSALNPTADGERAVGYLDDDEDSGGHTLWDTIMSAKNRLAAIEGNLQFYDEQKKKKYAVEGGKLPFFVHRDRGWALDEPGQLSTIQKKCFSSQLNFLKCVR